jgi:hypothetical protein
MAHYRIARTMPNGWQVRLDMISYDGAFGDTIVPLPEVVLLEMGALTAEFDSLPYGLMNPATFSFRLVWDQLPGAMQTYLEDAFAEYPLYLATSATRGICTQIAARTVQRGRLSLQDAKIT